MREREKVTIPDLDVGTIVQVLDDAPVTLGVLYGSHARGDSTPDSDIDLAVEFEESLSSGERTRERLGLIERLTMQLETDDVDVVPLPRVSAELLEEIIADGVLVYGSLTDLKRYDGQSVERTSSQDRIAQFDDVLTELERIV